MSIVRVDELKNSAGTGSPSFPNKLNYVDFPPGTVIQTVRNEITTSSVFSSPTPIPVDNTIPQITEGGEFLTCNITPRFANSKLFIQCVIFICENTNHSDFTTVAMFRDSLVNAISVTFNNTTPSGSTPMPNSGIQFNPMYLSCYIDSGSLLSTTFRLRGSGNTAGDMRINGANGNQFFNGTLVTSMTIQEIRQ